MPATTPFTLTAPRDGRSPVRERLEWLTDLQTSRNGTERRVQLRATPRHFVGFDVLLHTAAARTTLAQLLTPGADYVLPLWQHAYQRPQFLPDVGHNTALAANASPVGRGGLVFTNMDGAAELLFWPDPNWPPVGQTWVMHTEAEFAAPAAVGRLTSEARQLLTATRQVSLAPVEFQLLDYAESVGAWDGLTVGGTPSLDEIAAHAEPGSLTGEAVSTVYDPQVGDPLRRAWYSKQTLELSLVLPDRAAILAFRRLLFALKGRLNPVHYSPPIEGQAPGLFRLSADSVELQYVHPGLARCTFSLTRIS